MTNDSTPTDAARPATEALCVCGHPRSEHENLEAKLVCMHRMTGGKQAADYCPCLEYRPALAAQPENAK